MRALTVHLKATYLQLRVYIWAVVLMLLLGRLTEFIIYLIDNSPNKGISDGNMLILILLILAIVLPLSYYRRIVHSGASRKQYYKGLHSVFAVWAAVIALFNSLWPLLEEHVFHRDTVDLVVAFHWDEFGWAGAFLYQLAFYLMSMALLSMLVSGYYRVVGWLLWAMLIAAVSTGTSVDSLRVHVAAFFKTLLFNESLLAGVGLNLLLFAVFLAGGWLFTRGRTH